MKQTLVRTHPLHTGPTDLEPCRRDNIGALSRQRSCPGEVDGHLASNTLRHTLLGALGVALMRRSSSLGVIHLGALLEAATHAVDSALARLGLGGKRAITATVSLLAQTGSVGAVSVLRAVVQTGANIASISRPARVAVALTLNTLAVARATLALSGATSGAVSTTPSVLTRADTIEALSVSRAVRIPTGLLGTIVSLVPLVTDALHLITDGNALTVSRAG